MLTKKAQSIVLDLKEEVKELAKEGEKIAKVYDAKYAECIEATSLFNAWQWFDKWDYQEKHPKETKRAKETRENDPHKRVKILDILANEQDKARDDFFVAEVNLKNYVDYMAKKIAELVRPNWREFCKKGGFKDLGEALTPTYEKGERYTSHSFYIYFSFFDSNIKDEGLESEKSAIVLNVSIGLGVAIGISGEARYRKMGGGVSDEPQEIEKPHTLTISEYQRAVKKLERINKQARQTLDKLVNEAEETVENIGLSGHLEHLARYDLKMEK